VTRPNALILDGSEVKLRLEAERTAHKSPVHVDWVRFTCLLRNVVPTFVSLLDDFPRPGHSTFSDMPEKVVREQISKTLSDFEAEHKDPAFLGPMQQALDLAREICAALGPDFVVHHVIGKGHDFYKYRWSIHRNDAECGWVGFLASGESPRQQAQASTIHANIYGSACTFARHGWNDRIANIVDMHDAKLTRADLALDFFDGMGIDMEEIKAEYMSGLMDSQGKRLKCNMVGDWANGAERSFYVGSKEAGKQTNIYEKGDQLFGRESNSPWVRIELRYGNKLRHLSSDLLRRPADFFAGASDWHALALTRCDYVCTPQNVPTNGVLAAQTVQAEVTRNVRWALNTAAPTIAAAFEFMGESFLELVTHKKLPGRLQKFSKAELSRAFSNAFSPAGGLSPSLA